MNVEELRWLYDYDRWATGRILALLDDLPAEAWAGPNRIGDRSLGEALVHQLGAAQRWRVAIETQGAGELPAPEREPLLSPAELRRRWALEWVAIDAWLPGVSQGLLDHVDDGVAVWQMLVHVINHSTQHRSEAAVVLTAEGRSPGEIDLIYYAEERAASEQPAR